MSDSSTTMSDSGSPTPEDAQFEYITSGDLSPRINSGMMSMFNGRIVRILGKLLEKKDTGDGIFLSSDMQELKVVCSINGCNSLITGEYFEIVGTVQGSILIALRYIEMGDNVDLGLVNDVIDLTHRKANRHIFGLSS
ncbi:hypothetical protein B0H13DRAFT_2307209 [Mycena leptocephala]|nr:hypothetical protein B0H13DRAFT_2307209 [Mycena leptocephala]